MSKVSQIITETVLKRMEEAEKNGEVFYWVKPFSEGSPNKPYSYDTGIPYRGINRILLDNDEFLTFAKVQEMNKKKDAVQYHIRKGAKANIVSKKFYRIFLMIKQTRHTICLCAESVLYFPYFFRNSVMLKSKGIGLRGFGFFSASSCHRLNMV